MRAEREVEVSFFFVLYIYIIYIPYLLDQKLRLLIFFYSVAVEGHSSRVATIQELII